MNSSTRSREEVKNNSKNLEETDEIRCKISNQWYFCSFGATVRNRARMSGTYRYSLSSKFIADIALIQ